MIRHPHVTGVVLAGGKASRLDGMNKAVLPIGPGPGSTTLERILGVFGGRFAGCILVGPGPEAYMGLPVTVIDDLVPGCGPLGGLHAGLGAIKTPFAFACGCDMPFLSGVLLDAMVRRIRPGRLLVPVLDGRPEPLHAFYPASCGAAVEAAMEEGVRKMSELFERVPVDYYPEEAYREIEGSRRSFLNVNTPEDLAAARGVGES